MWGNCFNRLWYNLETCNSFLKSLRYRCFPVNFEKILRTSFLQNTSGQLLLDFFIHFTVFAARWTNIKPVFFLLLNMFYHGFRTWWISWTETISCCCSQGFAAREHKFLGDITWNLAVFCRLISFFICTYWIFVLHCPGINHPWNT